MYISSNLQERNMGNKRNEEKVLDLFKEDLRLTRSEIGKKINKEDPSGIIRDLVYFDYLVKNADGTLSRTDKQYTAKHRANEQKPENYEIALNKVFTGSHLDFNIGHEIINFIKDQEGQRYVYLNPWGARGKEAARKTRYVFHIIDSSLNDENGKIYELIAVSEIDQKAKVNYKKGVPKDLNGCPVFEGHNFYDIFYCGFETDKAYYYTYKASKLFRPKDNIRIILKINRNKATITHDEENNKIVVELMCNPQHSICYADASGKITYGSTPNENNDKSILESLINHYVVESEETIDINTIDDEQCFSIISGRAQLEVSTSNQIAYFLRRDYNLIYSFLHDFLGVNSVSKDERFDIVREREESIDLLFKSDKHIIVVENKIDSKINGKSKESNEKGKYNSQLSKYYDYIEKTYSYIETRKYFVLAPEYNDISQQQLNDVYEKGDKFILKTYNQLFEKFQNLEYSPLGLNPSSEQKFLFSQFKKSVEYLTWSKGKQRERIAYIRLKQRVTELNAIQKSKNK